jgi:hypothetical protein
VFGNAVFPGLAAWWKLDEKEGTTAADASGNGHTGTLEGNPQWQPAGGKIGGALMLDGDKDCVDTGYSKDLGHWTAAVWVKSPESPGSEGHSGPVHREKNLQINWDHGDDAFRGAAAVCVGGNWYSARFGELQGNTWYHLVATYDGEDLKAYKDGVLITDNSDPSGTPDPEESTLKLGQHSTKGECFKGALDDVRIYNYALTEAQVHNLWKGSPSL